MIFATTVLPNAFVAIKLTVHLVFLVTFSMVGAIAKVVPNSVNVLNLVTVRLVLMELNTTVLEDVQINVEI